MTYLISEMFLYLLSALITGIVMGWLLRGLQLGRYTRSLQQQLDQQKSLEN